MKKIIGIVAALVIGIAVYWLFFQVSYSGDFDILINGTEYELELESTERVDVDDDIIYSVIYSGNGNSVRVVFKLWEEDGKMWIDFDTPTVRINGKLYTMSRSLRNSDYDVYGFSDGLIQVAFFNLPYSEGFKLDGGFCLIPHNTKLY